MNQSKCRSHFVISIFLCFILPCLAGCKKKTCLLSLTNRANVKEVVSYKRSFGNLNDVQLKAAHAWGWYRRWLRAKKRKRWMESWFILSIMVLCGRFTHLVYSLFSAARECVTRYDRGKFLGFIDC